MTDLLDFIYLYILGTIELLVGFHFFIKFLGKRAKVSYYLFFAIAGIIVLSCSSGGIIEFFAYILLFTVSGMIICRANMVTALLYAVITFEIMQLCYGIFNSLSCIVSPILFSINSKIAGWCLMILGYAFALLVSAFCYRAVYHYFSCDETGNGKYGIMLLIPALMIFQVSKYINSSIYGNTITVKADGILTNANHYQMFIIQLLGLASLFCIMYAYKKMAAGFQLRMELSLLEQEAHSLQQYVQEAKTRYEKTKSFRHDVKNHITVVKKLIQNSNTEEALRYIGDMENMTSDMSFPVSTNNPALDILLGNKLGIAKDKHIDIVCSLTVPYPCGVNDIDFCIILSNALDNAIHACNKMDYDIQKYIRVEGNIQGDFILLEVENSYIGKGGIKKGTGLANIKAVVEKYNGAMNIKTEEQSFTLSILLIIPQHSENISQQIG